MDTNSFALISLILICLPEISLNDVIVSDNGFGKSDLVELQFMPIPITSDLTFSQSIDASISIPPIFRHR